MIIIPGAATGGVKSGTILMWSGSVASIPSGYVLCNGSNSTPDLRNKFVIAAEKDTAGVATTSITGANTQNGTPFLGGLGFSGQTDGVALGQDWQVWDAGANLSSTIPNFTAVPAYYALAYIMKT